MTGENCRLWTRLLTQIERVLNVNDPHLISPTVVEAPRNSLGKAWRFAPSNPCGPLAFWQRIPPVYSAAFVRAWLTFGFHRDRKSVV